MTLLLGNLNESEALRREYVATGYVVHQDQVLLIWHRELHQWLPPGGHIELDELPDDAVVREIFEETGIPVRIIPERPLGDQEGVTMLHTPSHVQVERIDDVHEHVDFLYVCVPKEDHIALKGSEKAKWFSMKEIEKLSPNVAYWAKQSVEIARDLLSTSEL